MDARAKSVREILHAGDQYLVPFFQRHYSWKLTQWQQLWDDVRALLPEEVTKQHFMGPLVCTPHDQIPAEVPVYMLIDGQQRLTTLTVMLAAIRDLASQMSVTSLVQQITEDFLIHKWQKDIKRYKVIPRVGDREVLFAVVDGQTGKLSRRDGIMRAYHFFHAAIGAYVKDDPQTLLPRVFSATTSRLSLVVVTIKSENPYEIFESLNSRGLPLEESDLIRNYVFMLVPLDEQRAFHEKHWQPFELLFEETDDHDAVAPTLFYRDYLMRDGTYSRKKSTFVDFKEATQAKTADPAALVGELQQYAKYELMLRRPTTIADARMKRALRQIALLKITTAHPLLMYLMARREKGAITDDEFLGCLYDLQSFVIRRAVCGESTRGYGEMFPAAIKAIGSSPRENLRRYWLERGWPDDVTMASQLVDFPLYRREVLKTRAILEALEESFGHKEQADLEKLTIEHVMPQTIDDDKHGRAWQEMLGPSWHTVHGTSLDTLGNLTLTGYNSNLSNKSYERKQAEFLKSNVQLNKYFAGASKWDKDAIQSRGKMLAEKVVSLWERPPGKYKQATETTVIDDFPSGEADIDFSQLEYWTEFAKTLKAFTPEIEPKALNDRSWVSFPSPRAASRFAVVMDKDDGCVSVELCLTGKYRTSDLHVLEDERETIDADLGLVTEWEYDNPCKVIAYLDAVDVNDRSDWPRQHQWLAETLKKFHDAIGCRIYTSFDGRDAKKILFAFWTGFDLNLAESNIGIELDSAKPKEWREHELKKGVSLWMRFAADENWVGAGLQFEGKKAMLVFDAAKQKDASLAAATGTAVDVETQGSKTWLSMYRFARLDEKGKWPEYHGWLAKILLQSKRIAEEAMTETANV